MQDGPNAVQEAEEDEHEPCRSNEKSKNVPHRHLRPRCEPTRFTRSREFCNHTLIGNLKSVGANVRILERIGCPLVAPSAHCAPQRCSADGYLGSNPQPGPRSGLFHRHGAGEIEDGGGSQPPGTTPASD